MMNRTNRDNDIAITSANPLSGSSLVPMLVSGLVLIVVGMIAVAVLS